MRAKVGSLRALRRAFKDLPTSVEASGRSLEDQDLEFRVYLGRTYKLRTRWVGQGWPSEVKRAIPEVSRGWPRELVATARHFSTGALELLSDLDANWADESGQARILHPPGIAIVRQPPREKEQDGIEKTIRWSPSAVAIAEYILKEGARVGPANLEIRTGTVHRETGWSPPQVSQVLQAFDATGWMASRGGRSGRHAWRELVNAGALLDAWADHVALQSFRTARSHLVARDLVRFMHMQLGPALEKQKIEWALTGWAGLELLAPFATATPLLQIYVASEAFDALLPSVLREIGMREVDEGARVEFRAAEFKLWRDVVEPPTEYPVWVASIPRVYADLKAMGGRGADAAAHLREVKIGF